MPRRRRKRKVQTQNGKRGHLKVCQVQKDTTDHSKTATVSEDLDLENQKHDQKESLQQLANADESQQLANANESQQLADADESQQLANANESQQLPNADESQQLPNADESQQLPNADESQHAFMNALGMHGISQRIPASDSAVYADILKRKSSSSKKPEQQSFESIQKVALLKLLKTNPVLPLTSKHGQRYIKELGGTVNPGTQTDYEKYCTTNVASRLKHKMVQKVKIVTKRVILRQNKNPHVYSSGRRQRTLRYQEIVLGILKRSWASFNACKPVRMKLVKIPCTMGKAAPVKIKSNKTSYLERKFAIALATKVRIENIDHLVAQMKLRKIGSTRSIKRNRNRRCKAL